MTGKTCRRLGGGSLILSAIIAFIAAGAMDGGSPLEILLVLVLAAMALLISGTALIKAAKELEELQAINKELFESLSEPSPCSECEIDYFVKEREISCR